MDYTDYDNTGTFVLVPEGWGDDTTGSLTIDIDMANYDDTPYDKAVRDQKQKNTSYVKLVKG